MAEQTAVEWLIHQLISLDKELDGRRKNEDATVLKINPTKLFEEAKAMEYEQKKEIALHFMMLGIKNKGDYSKIDFYKEIDKDAN